ncbi:MAG: fused MFS/spermidine synthase [Myxococcales bacterium]|nr:fused MFS/spermidine synthase [Myxococcales bacterium]
MTDSPLSASPGQALFRANAFLAAGLMFVAEPMLAKWLLPQAGGSAGTWAACLVTYQLLLLAGYVYADLLTRRVPRAAQLLVHGGLVVAALISLQLLSKSSPPRLSVAVPALSVAWALLRELGLPFFLLASSAPLGQSWAATTSERSPFSLYAVSNAGSLAGLLAYPLLLEPLLPLGLQRQLFAWGFVGFALTVLGVALRVRSAPGHPRPHGSEVVDAPTESVQSLRWVGLSFVPSLMLVAATNHLTVDIAPTPLLWVVPLALYLLSFILAFSAWRETWRAPLCALWLVGAVLVGVNAFAEAKSPLWRQLGGTLLALFAACTLCHGELAHRRPALSRLTRYYILIALGGVLGGAFVSLGAPLLFDDVHELELGSIATFGLLFWISRPPSSWQRGARLLFWLGAATAVPLSVANLWLRLRTHSAQGSVVWRGRSFYGPLRVVDVAAGRLLTNGRIQHGLQLRGAASRDVPTLYFGRGTALARVFDLHHPERPRRVGIIGLGAGTIASYGRSGDDFRFYELDPSVLAIARRDFSFLADSPAHIEVALGDGRLLLAGEKGREFDILVLDAFTSDAVPVHLLTTEAFQLYARQLAPDGVLLAHISNRYLAIDQVVRASARAAGLAVVVIETGSRTTEHVTHAEWAVAVRDARTLSELTRELPTKPGAETAWTDDHASWLSVLR